LTITLGIMGPAPKARSIPAWGNAPGIPCAENQGLKARSIAYEPGFQPSGNRHAQDTWGVAPGWYESGPSALFAQSWPPKGGGLRPGGLS